MHGIKVNRHKFRIGPKHRRGRFFEETTWEDSRTYIGETVTNVHTGSNGNAIHIVWSKGNHFVHIHCKSKKGCDNEWNEVEGTEYDTKFDVETKEDKAIDFWYLKIKCKKCRTNYAVNL